MLSGLTHSGEPTTWKATMRSSHVRGGAVLCSLIAVGIGLAVAPTASADPNGPAQTDAPAPPAPANAAPAPGPAPAALPDPAPATDAVPATPDAASVAGPAAPDGAAAPAGPDPVAQTACKQFGAALSYAASNYEDFAYDTAGHGDSVDYSNPAVVIDNQPARTALRAAAAAAMDAANTPGLDPAIAAPMQSWSLHAAQLILVMGLHGGGDALNSTATDMNTDGHKAQMACAAAGAHA